MYTDVDTTWREKDERTCMFFYLLFFFENALWRLRVYMYTWYTHVCCLRVGRLPFLLALLLYDDYYYHPTMFTNTTTEATTLFVSLQALKHADYMYV